MTIWTKKTKDHKNCGEAFEKQSNELILSLLFIFSRKKSQNHLPVLHGWTSFSSATLQLGIVNNISEPFENVPYVYKISHRVLLILIGSYIRNLTQNIFVITYYNLY